MPHSGLEVNKINTTDNNNNNIAKAYPPISPHWPRRGGLFHSISHEFEGEELELIEVSNRDRDFYVLVDPPTTTRSAAQFSPTRSLLVVDFSLTDQDAANVTSCTATCSVSLHTCPAARTAEKKLTWSPLRANLLNSIWLHTAADHHQWLLREKQTYWPKTLSSKKRFVHESFSCPKSKQPTPFQMNKRWRRRSLGRYKNSNETESGLLVRRDSPPPPPSPPSTMQCPHKLSIPCRNHIASSSEIHHWVSFNRNVIGTQLTELIMMKVGAASLSLLVTGQDDDNGVGDPQRKGIKFALCVCEVAL